MIKSFVGGHDINIYQGCRYDESIRKYRGGTLLMTIPYSGRMLSASSDRDEAPLTYKGIQLPVMTKEIFTAVDPVPDAEECDFCVVSAKYAAACSALGADTSRLLTIGDPVADENGTVIGCMNLNRN